MPETLTIFQVSSEVVHHLTSCFAFKEFKKYDWYTFDRKSVRSIVLGSKLQKKRCFDIGMVRYFTSIWLLLATRCSLFHDCGFARQRVVGGLS